MPIYNYECKKCGHSNPEAFFKTFVVICEKCSSKKDIEIKPSIGGLPNFGFKPFVTEHITGNPVFIDSRQTKRRLMKQFGVSERG